MARPTDQAVAAPAESASRPRIVIVGAGFGGLAAARALAGADVDATIVDRRNHHVFQPLLYQVATAGLSPADIAAPIRAIVRDQQNLNVVLGDVTGIDASARLVRLADGGALPYDWLILATGARHSYFGRDDWAAHAPGIKSLEDATDIRRRVLLAMERAERTGDPADHAERKALLTFVIIGGGPTGLEMAGAIAELARRSVSQDFRSITPHCSRVVLVEGGNRLLASFPEQLSQRAGAALAALGVEVRLGERVTGIDAAGVTLAGGSIAARTVIWAAGVEASPAAQWLGCAADRAGRITVTPDLAVPGHPEIFAIGDTAACPDGRGGFLPGIAPVAKRQGRQVARAILARIGGRTPPAFTPGRDAQLATIGRAKAVIAFGGLRLSGFPAWVLWSVAHVWFLVGFRNRFVVGANWLWNYFTFERGARLIIGNPMAAPAPAGPPESTPEPTRAPPFEPTRALQRLKGRTMQNLHDELAGLGQRVLVLQGGGALGAYQAGVYQALDEAGISPDWVIGTSIGAINAALIAGSKPGDRLPKLKEFWRRVEHKSFLGAPLPNWFTAAARNMMTVATGIPSFFAPTPAAFFSMHSPLGPERAGYYSTDALESTLTELIDWDLVNNGAMRLTVGASQVRTSEMVYFDSRDGALDTRHVMASGALPPAFPAVRIDGELYWDGGILSNTPVEVVFDDNPRRDSVVFAVHLWNPHGAEPETIWEVMNRQKDVQYSSRALNQIKRQRQLHRLRHIVAELGRRLPDDLLRDNEIAEMLGYGCLTRMHVIRLLAPSLTNEDHAKDIDFSSEGISQRWEAGYRHTCETLEKAPWRAPYEPTEGFILHEACGGEVLA